MQQLKIPVLPNILTKELHQQQHLNFLDPYEPHCNVEQEENHKLEYNKIYKVTMMTYIRLLLIHFRGYSSVTCKIVNQYP